MAGSRLSRRLPAATCAPRPKRSWQTLLACARSTTASSACRATAADFDLDRESSWGSDGARPVRWVELSRDPTPHPSLPHPLPGGGKGRPPAGNPTPFTSRSRRSAARPPVHSPNTYSTVALRCSLSSGALARLRLPLAGSVPDAIATYCRPLTSKVIGGAEKAEPILIFHNSSSEVSS